MKRNCWDVMQCGRQHGGARTNELGVCSVSTEKRLDGVNGGTNGGRSCWVLPLTLYCDDKVRREFTKKFASCFYCRFYELVREEEGNNFALSNEITEKLDMLITAFR